jgi:hypothetical protein
MADVPNLYGNISDVPLAFEDKLCSECIPGPLWQAGRGGGGGAEATDCGAEVSVHPGLGGKL